MNSFFIPSLGGQMYAMPGMQSQLQLQADEAGNYRGLSAQFSGDGFSDMHFQVLATDDAGFEAWVARTKSATTPLDAASYDRLVAEHKVGEVTYYSPVSNGLFDHAIEYTTKRPGSALAASANTPRANAPATALTTTGSEH
jgi:cytochrome o ubiquinol oxidase subunit 2